MRPTSRSCWGPIVLAAALGCGSGDSTKETPPPVANAPGPWTGNTQPTAPKRTPFARFYVEKNGAVQLNGKPVTLEQVKLALDLLAKVNGVVLYTLEPQDPEAVNPEAKKVVDLIISKHLPMRMCLKPDCTDRILPNGTLRADD